MKTTIRQSYIDLKGINLGAAFVREHKLQFGQKYPMTIDGLSDVEINGTLDRSGFIGGLSVLYKTFDLCVEDQLGIAYDDSVIRITPPQDKRRTQPTEPDQVLEAGEDTRPVFERQRLRHVHIEPYAPGNLSNWVPQTEADVYMVFGALSEYTDYRYCCGASLVLIDRLGYRADTKPDAFLIDRATGQYLVAEFKMNSKDFLLNHKKEDIDVLICWEDDATDRTQLPPHVVGLRSLLEKALEEGEIDL